MATNARRRRSLAALELGAIRDIPHKKAPLNSSSAAIRGGLSYVEVGTFSTAVAS